MGQPRACALGWEGWGTRPRPHGAERDSSNTVVVRCSRKASSSEDRDSLEGPSSAVSGEAGAGTRELTTTL